MPKQFYVYIATNKRNTVLYTGVTNNLRRRMYEHKQKLAGSFTARYNIMKLVYYEEFSIAEEAIAAEKKLKAGSREKKVVLIENKNPEYWDLLSL